MGAESPKSNVGCLETIIFEFLGEGVGLGPHFPNHSAAVVVEFDGFGTYGYMLYPLGWLK